MHFIIGGIKIWKTSMFYVLNLNVLLNPPDTLNRLINKAIIAIQQTTNWIYKTALHEWAGFIKAIKTWQQLKLHFALGRGLKICQQ
jgi:hypothetical protein